MFFSVCSGVVLAIHLRASQSECAETTIHFCGIYQQSLLCFSFKCRRVIGFASTMLHDWLKKLTPLFHLVRSKTKPIRGSLTFGFPCCFASATCRLLDWFTVLSVFFDWLKVTFVLVFENCSMKIL